MEKQSILRYYFKQGSLTFVFPPKKLRVEHTCCNAAPSFFPWRELLYGMWPTDYCRSLLKFYHTTITGGRARRVEVFIKLDECNLKIGDFIIFKNTFLQKKFF